MTTRLKNLSIGAGATVLALLVIGWKITLGLFLAGAILCFALYLWVIKGIAR